MKISPMAQSDGGQPQRTLTPNRGTSTGDAASRARAIMRGETSGINVTSADPALDAAVAAEMLKTQPKSIKMRTNATPGPRDYTNGSPMAPDAPAGDAAAPEGTQGTTDPSTTSTEAPSASAAPAPTSPENTPQPTPEVPTRSTSEQATPAAEDTKPLSPQSAALARQRRALQVKERELIAREKALSETPKQDVVDRARLKAEPLSVLLEAGVTYEQLTEAVLADQNSPEIHKLREELRALKEGVDKSLTERDAQAEQAAISEMRREATRLAQSDDFELVRATGSIPTVLELIQKTHESSGEVLDVHEAMRLVEEDLVNETLTRAALKKVQSRLAPKPAAGTAPAAAPAPKQQAPAAAMRTLTNRDTATAPLDRKERAKRAFWGQK